MAKCKLCKKNIPDGSEYCIDCLDKKQVKTDESYLDSLLNSVKNSPEPVNQNYRITQEKPKQEPVRISKPAKQVNFDHIDPEDLADFNQFNLHADLEDPIVIGHEELFGRDDEEETDEQQEDTNVTDYSALPADTKSDDMEYPVTNLNNSNTNSLPEADIFRRQEYSTVSGNISTEADSSDLMTQSEALDRESDLSLRESEIDDMMQESEDMMQESEDAMQVPEDMMQEPNNNYQELADLQQEPLDREQASDNVDQEFLDMLMNQGEGNLDESEDIDPSIGELLSGFNLPDTKNEKETEQTDEDFMLLNGNTGSDDMDVEDDDNRNTDEEEFLSLLSQFGSDDPITADVQAITELLGGAGSNNPSVLNMPSDVGEVFSDALRAVSGLDDKELEDKILFSPVSDKEDKKNKKNKGKNKEKIANPKKSKKKSKSVKGKGFLGKLFGNVVDEEAIKASQKAKASEEAAATKETKKPKDKKAKKKGKGEPEVIQETEGRVKPGEENKPEDKKAKKKEKVKKPKKEKKGNIELIDDYEDVEGRINKLGASIVFAFFGILVLLLLIGTSLFTYSVSIKNATNYFERQKYTEAYNEVYGIDLKDEDIELYEKILTVMFVNKQLNSYNNFYAMKKYPEALDSLLKGLKRYDKYIELATILGIKSDLDYVRDQIMAELENVFMLTEAEAISIINSDSQKDYSVAVYDVVLENLQY